MTSFSSGLDSLAAEKCVEPLGKVPDQFSAGDAQKSALVKWLHNRRSHAREG
jgi:hypothetical protein